MTFPESAGRFYQHGWQSWSPTGWRPRTTKLRHPVVPEHQLQATDPAHLDDVYPGGAGLGAVELGEGQVSLLGSLGSDGWVTSENNRLVGTGAGPWHPITGEESTVFEGYARELGLALGARSADPGPVWCSWYGLYGEVSEDLMSRVIAEWGDSPFSIIQIDDGWQRTNGDWHPNDDFPSGMAAQAERIRTTGRTAGLWLAPFLADTGSELIDRYPEMLLRDESGNPVVAAHNWGDPTFALDVTRPDTQEWIGGLMRQVVAWGFTYLKLDFLYAAALPGAHHRTGEREGAYRRAAETIRAAVGPDVYLLACGAPMLPSIGVFDAIRVGPDAAPIWDDVNRTTHLADRSGPGAADAISTSLNRLWLKSVIGIDPDVAYFRSRYCLLTRGQRGLLVDLAHVCGFRAVSDPPWWLDRDERQALDTFLTEHPTVQQVGRHHFVLDGREVDFTPVVESRPW